MRPPPTLRKAVSPKESPRDWIEIRRICCETGNSGKPIDRSRWEFFAESWVGPYEKLCPEWTYVAVSSDQAVGYLTGCPDTREFRKLQARRFTPGLLARVLARRFARNGDTRRFVRWALHLDRGPEESFSREVRDHLETAFPAHLHVNVDEKFRSAGLGAQLVNRFTNDLQAQGVPGLHLFCGPMPIRFYERLGFTELSRIEFRPGVWVYCLVKTLERC